MKNLLSRETRAIGAYAAAGKLSRPVQEFLAEKGVEILEPTIIIEDWRAVRMLRHSKTNNPKDIALPLDIIERIPEILEKQAQAHWDVKAKVPTIVYTFDIPGDPKLGKYVVKVEYRLDRGVVRPVIVSGGRINERDGANRGNLEPIQ